MTITVISSDLYQLQAIYLSIADLQNLWDCIIFIQIADAIELF